MTTLNQVDIEKKTVDIAEFNSTDAALAGLREKYSVVPNAETPEGYELVKEGCKVLTGLRTAIEKKRKEIKAPYIEAGQIIDAEAKRITAAIVELENPLSAAKKLVDDKEKRLKEERIARLTDKINKIRGYVQLAKGVPSDRIAELLSEVDAIDATQDYYELTHEAVTVRADVLSTLGEMYNAQLNFEEGERLRAEQAEQLKKLEAAAEIERRISTLKMLPLDYMSRPLADVEAKLKSLEAYSPNAAEFGDRHTEAVTAQKAVIEQMTMLAQQKRQQEVAPVELPAEQAEQDTVKLAGNKSMPECELTMRRIPALADMANGTDEDTARNINNCDMVHGFDSASGEGFSVFKVECNIMDTAKIMQFIAGFEGTKVTRLIN